MKRERTLQIVPFRLIVTPCCGHNLCWVNPRFPSYCPMCGKLIYPDVKQAVMYLDHEAELILHEEVAGSADD